MGFISEKRAQYVADVLDGKYDDKLKHPKLAKFSFHCVMALIVICAIVSLVLQGYVIISAVV